MAASTAYAAGIGKLTVLSALGQPLRAEIELTATPDEFNSLTAKLASQDQFRQQGMDYTAAVAALHFSVEKRADGQPYVRLSSDRPINEPFLDILVELAWASGRLTREYTFLLDPVDQPRPANSSVTAPNVAPVADSPAPAMSNIPSKPAKSGKRSSTSRPVPAAQPAPAAPVPQSAASSAPVVTPSDSVATVEVKRGDTLGKIAADTTPDGASLDQMLVALYNSNRDAFIGSNLNRLKTGKILNVPDRDTVLAVNEGDAKKTVALHAQNFNAYRKQLANATAAGAPADMPATQSASGKITPKVEDKAPAPAAGQDKLEVSKSESGKTGKDGGKAASEADRAAADKALKDAEARVAALEKNVADLKKLNELQSQSLADAEKKASAAKTAPAPAPEAVKSIEPPKPVEAPKPDTVQADTAKSATQSSDAAKAEDKPADAKPAAAVPPPKKKIVLPPPEPEPSFMDEYSPFVSLGGALVVLLGGFFGFRAYRRRKADAVSDIDMPTVSQLDDVTSTSSVFGKTGGQSVNTQDVSLASDFSKASLTDGEGVTGVDPVAEAEVYMAYGRDAQAEEILLEALKSEPTRQAVHLKLLELYAARKSVKPFEGIARDLKQQTGGSGPNWDRATVLGQSIDPDNPLYGGLSVPAEDMAGTGTVVMQPGALAKLAAEAAPIEASATAAAAAEAGFDLDLGSETAVATPEAAGAAVAPLDFDLDLGAEEVPAAAPDSAAPLDLEVSPAQPAASVAAAAAAPIDFDLDLPSSSDAAPAAASPAAAAAPAADSGLDFDFNLDLPGSEVPAEALPAATLAAPKADFSGIDLNLDTAPIESPAASVASQEASAAIDEADNPEVATKLELAQAYEEMGDKEGMRELLQEVLVEGNTAQQEVARSKLALHGF